ncbi:hypothetical protein JCM19233_1923 [Vibrio astriarenae]|nr:hypothetical protein JCM19233_1923 [Vibrio sp. C7]
MNDDVFTFENDFEHHLVVDALCYAFSIESEESKRLYEQMVKYLPKGLVKEYGSRKLVSQKVSYMLDEEEISDLVLNSETYLDLVEAANTLLYESGELIELEALPVKRGSNGYKFCERGSATHHYPVNADYIKSTFSEQKAEPIMCADIEICFGGKGAVSVTFDFSLFNEEAQLSNASFFNVEDAHNYILDNWMLNRSKLIEKSDLLITQDVGKERANSTELSQSDCPLDRLLCWYAAENEEVEKERESISIRYHHNLGVYESRQKKHQRLIRAFQMLNQDSLDRYNAYCDGTLMGYLFVEVSASDDEWRIGNEYFCSTDISCSYDLQINLRNFMHKISPILGLICYSKHLISKVVSSR